MFREYLENTYANRNATPNTASAALATASGVHSMPSASPSSKPLDVRVDLWFQNAEETKKGGHDFVSLHTDMNLNYLQDALQTSFKRLQNLPYDQRPNLESDAVWSDSHKIAKIKAVPKAVNDWDGVDHARESIICEDNCQRILRAMEQGHGPEGLAVFLSRPLPGYSA